MFIAQPISSILSGWVTEQLGRKRAMMLANVPHLFAWTMLGLATSVEQVFAAGVLLSIGVGLMESSIITYVGEISHPSVRGVLLALANVFVMAGISTMYLMGSVTHWRTAAFCSLALPLVTTVALLFVSVHCLRVTNEYAAVLHTHPFRAGARDAVLAALAAARRRCAPFASVAARLGLSESSAPRVR